MTPSRTHLVVIPSYNPGPLVVDVVRSVYKQHQPVWIVIDGSNDGSAQLLRTLAEDWNSDSIRLIVLEENQGKGAAVLAAVSEAVPLGFTHLLVFDSDGQHSPDLIPTFIAESEASPEAMILGKPVFGPEAPVERVWWRKVANGLTALLTLGGGIGDALFGMRVYPLEPLRRVMAGHRHGRRFDFEPEVAVRLSWSGVRAACIDTPVKYLAKSEGGVSHFRYGRDNLLLFSMYGRLLVTFFLKWPMLIRRRWS